MTNGNASELVRTGLQRVTEAKNKLNLKKPTWTTSCVIDLFGKDVNIQVCTDMFMLVRAYSTFKEMLKAMKSFNRAIPIEEQNYRGFAISDWIGDIERRIKYLIDSAQLQKLNQVEVKLTPLLTEDQKRENELNKILESFPDLFK